MLTLLAVTMVLIGVAAAAIAWLRAALRRRRRRERFHRHLDHQRAWDENAAEGGIDTSEERR